MSKKSKIYQLKVAHPLNKVSEKEVRDLSKRKTILLLNFVIRTKSGFVNGHIVEKI